MRRSTDTIGPTWMIPPGVTLLGNTAHLMSSFAEAIVNLAVAGSPENPADVIEVYEKVMHECVPPLHRGPRTASTSRSP